MRPSHHERSSTRLGPLPTSFQEALKPQTRSQDPKHANQTSFRARPLVSSALVHCHATDRRSTRGSLAAPSRRVGLAPPRNSLKSVSCVGARRRPTSDRVKERNAGCGIDGMGQPTPRHTVSSTLMCGRPWRGPPFWAKTLRFCKEQSLHVLSPTLTLELYIPQVILRTPTTTVLRASFRTYFLVNFLVFPERTNHSAEGF